MITQVIKTPTKAPPRRPSQADPRVADQSAGGYTYQFVETPPEIVRCVICHLPSKDPYLSECCGHNFCVTCLQQCKTTPYTENACPMCSNINFKAIPNKQIDREVRYLHVYCMNKDKGCTWKGEINDISGHLGNSNGCQYEEVKCMLNCLKTMQRQHLANHMKDKCSRRKVNCEYCEHTGEDQFIKGKHKDECLKFPLSCPNKCNNVLLIQRQHLADHMKNRCSRRMVNCQYCNTAGEDQFIKGKHKDGCQKFPLSCPNKCGITAVQRQHLVDHMKRCPSRKVNCQYCHAAGECQIIEGKHKDVCRKFPLSCPNKCEVGSVPREDMEAHRKECSLEMIPCEYDSVGCKVSTPRKRKRSHLEEHMEEHLRMTKAKLAKTEDRLLSTEARVNNLEVMLSCLVQTNSMSGGRATVPINWATQLATLAATMLNAACPVIIKLPQFASHVQTHNMWYSDPFYTDKDGYRMLLYAKINDNNDGLSVGLRLMKGPHDDKLPWPLKRKFEVTVLNHLSNSEHLSAVLPCEGIASRVTDDKVNKDLGLFRLISLKDLNPTIETCRFLKDDCVFLQVKSYVIQ